MRRAGALLCGAPLLAGLLQLPAAGPAQAASSDTVSVSLDSLSPNAPTDGDTLTVSGTVTNNGKQTVTDAHVGLRVGPPLTTRSAIDSVARHSDETQGSTGTDVGDKYEENFDKLPPGVAEHFTISVPVDKLDLGDDGVYEFGVALSGQTSAQPWDQVLGIQRTFLPWQSSDADTRTKTTFLWPLISTVHMTAKTGAGEAQTPEFLDDDLAKELGPGGRLTRMVELGKDLDVTWVIDPDLLASVDAMAAGNYRLQDPDGTSTPGSRENQAAAKQWLAGLQKAVAGKEVVALPFGDPDLASLAHRGTSVTGSLSHLKDASDVAAITVKTVLHVTPSTDFAWPVDGAVDPSIMKVATSAGADRVIARSDSLQETAGLTYTPSAARPVGGGTTAVVADARLSTAFEDDLTKAGSATLAVQRFLAQSLELNAQTDKQRSIVVAPQRMPTASQAQAMATALKALQGGTWSQPQDLTATAKDKPDPGATTRIPSRSAYPSSLRRQELRGTAFQQIARTQDKLDRFRVVLTNQSRVVTPFGRAINREMSASWRGRSDAADGYRDGVEDWVDDLAEQVKLIDKSETKLSGRSATIPVTVQNNLVQPVGHLVLRLTSTQPTRLEIGGKAYDEQPVEISGGHSQSVKFTTSANANGRVTVLAQLFTEDGQPYGDAVSFDVKVTEVTPTVMLVIGGGVLLLVLAGFRMYTQRKRAAARQAEEDGPGPAEEGADEPGNPEAPGDRLTGESGSASGADDPEHPSDPAPDTAPESADPSGTGERVDR
ncbi:membrane protein [Streptomyces sp. NRRL B-3648]|nr:membrane protein [Streptomyces sp. NRRL B-3648]